MNKYKVIFTREYIIEANTKEIALEKARTFLRLVNSRMFNYKIEQEYNEK